MLTPCCLLLLQAMCAEFDRASELTRSFHKAYPNFHHLHCEFLRLRLKHLLWTHFADRWGD